MIQDFKTWLKSPTLKKPKFWGLLCSSFIVILIVLLVGFSTLDAFLSLALGPITERINSVLKLQYQNGPIWIQAFVLVNLISALVFCALSILQTIETLKPKPRSTSFTGRVFFLFAPLLSRGSKKEKPWGLVYDSVTKKPIDPAMVTITVHENGVGEFKQTRVTDIEGRFSFLVTPGRYVITAAKTNYSFPSKLVKGETDGNFKNVYHGEVIEIENPYIINLNIPMDPLGFDWNQSIKKDSSNASVDFIFQNRRSLIIVFGVLITTLAYPLSPSSINLFTIGLYLFNSLFIKTYIEQRLWGTVTYRITGEPASRIIIKAIRKPFNLTVANTTTDHLGRYFLLLSQGSYAIALELKKEDGSVEILKTIENINVTKKKKIINFDIGI